MTFGARVRYCALDLPMRQRWPVAIVVLALAAGCSDPEKARIKNTTRPTYDKTTGKLTQLTSDANKNGRIDTWTDMDGARPIQSRVDLDEDGTIDRWEYYDGKGALVKVGFSRKKDGKPDAWAFPNADGTVDRLETSSTSDPSKIDRWERYAPFRPAPNGDNTGALLSAEEDTNRDGRPDKWETYEHGELRSAAFDENADGKPDRRLTYADGRLAFIESEPDASGRFQKRMTVK